MIAEPFFQEIQPLPDGRTRCTIKILAEDVSAYREMVVRSKGWIDTVSWPRENSLLTHVSASNWAVMQFTLPIGVPVQHVIGITEDEIARLKGVADFRDYPQTFTQGVFGTVSVIGPVPVVAGTARAVDAPRELTTVHYNPRPVRARPDYYALRDRYIRSGDPKLLKRMLGQVNKSNAGGIVDKIRTLPDPPSPYTDDKQLPLETYLRRTGKLPAAPVHLKWSLQLKVTTWSILAILLFCVVAIAVAFDF